MNSKNNWESFYKENYGNKYPETPLIRFISKRFSTIKNKKDIKILDIGCGSGATISFLSREGYTAFGIDASSTAIENCKTRLEDENLEAEVIVGDFKKLPFKNNFFNCITDIASLQHNSDSDIQLTISEIYRTLSKDGLVFFMLISDNKNLSDERFYTNYISDKKIEKMLSKFHIIEKNYLKYSEQNGEKYIKFNLIEAKKRQ